MAKSTTIQVSRGTRSSLETLKSHSRETFDEIISKLLSLVPEGDEEGMYTSEFRAGLLEALYDSKKGKTFTAGQIRKQLKMV